MNSRSICHFFKHTPCIGKTPLYTLIMKYTSQLIAAGSGSMGGCTASRNRFGKYMRARSVPVNPNSTQQQTMRAALTTLVARWTSTLTDVQRGGWETWAANTPQTDALGQTYNMTGQNAYISMNALRIQTGTTIIDTAPEVFAGAPLTPPNATALSEATQDFDVTFTNTDAWATAVGGKLIVYASRPQNPSKLFYKGPYRLSGTINGAVSAPTSPATLFVPFPVAQGQIVHFCFRAIQADGRISGKLTDVATCGA